MHKELFIDSVDLSTDGNGNTFVNGKEIGFKDAAFLAYYLLRAGKAKESLSIIEAGIAEISTRKEEYIEIALWLWIVGEYTNRTKDNQLIDKHSFLIKRSIDYLAGEWMNPRQDWLSPAGPDVYASNLAIAFGAVQSIANSVDSEAARKLLKEIKAYLFKHFLAEGKVVSALHNREVMGDIGIIAVPFCLIDAGNQILVESIKTFEEKLGGIGVGFSNEDNSGRMDLTSLMSWYYSERGDTAKAKQLLLVAESQLSGNAKQEGIILPYALYLIAQLNIAEKERTDIIKAGTEIIHRAEGTGNRYMLEPFQRLPVYPLEDEEVVLMMVTQPMNDAQKAVIEYSINGVKSGRVQMEQKTSVKGEKYWEAGIGKFAFGSSVEYRFIVEVGDDNTISDKYSFIVRKWAPIGPITSVKKERESVCLYFQPMSGEGKQPVMCFSKVGGDTCVSFSLTEGFCDLPYELSDVIEIGSVRITIENSQLSGVFAGNLSSYKGKRPFMEYLTDGGGTVYKARYNFEIGSGECFFGMGERYSRMEYRGLDIDNYVYNQYTDQKLRTYIPVPFAISSRGYGIYADTTMYSVFRFGTTAEGLLEIEADISPRTQSMDMYLFTGFPKEILMSFTGISGRPELPPKWAFGPWMSSNNWDSQAETLKQAELTEMHAIPATVIVLEQWSDEATFYIFNDASYKLKGGEDCFVYEDFAFPEWGRWPDPKKMIKSLHSKGLKVLLWQVAAMKHMDGIAHTQRDEDEEYMIKQGYCAKYEDGRPYRIPSYEWFKRSLVPDFTNPAARDWWLKKRLYLLKELKIDGFKTDGGECVYGQSVMFYDGRTGDEIRNIYPNEYIKSFHKFAKEHRNNDTVTFSRAGYAGAQKTPMHWAGDESSTFEAYRASVIAGLSCGMSGIPFWGWDIAGFHGEIPTAELFIRSVQFAAFCPVMQYHAETRGEQNRDRSPWNIAERTGESLVLSLYKALADLRMNMLPYIYEQAKISIETGLPLMRAMQLEHPDDEKCMSAADQYYFGESLLAAPVIQEGSNSRDVYFPLGSWIDFFGNERFEGKHAVRVQCGLERIPVFIKENSVIPLNLAENLALCSHVGNQTDGYTNLCFMIYATEKAFYRFEDEHGNRIEISAEKSACNMHVSISGNILQPVVLILRAQPPCKSAERNGSALIACATVPLLCVDGYCIRGNDLLVKIDSDSDISLAWR